MGGKGTALVLGATGGIGGETAGALLRHGWTVVAMARGPAGRCQVGGRSPLVAGFLV